MPGGGRAASYEDQYRIYAGHTGDSNEVDDLYAATKRKLSVDPVSPLALVTSGKLRCWLFPTAFTLFCFATFTVPIYLMSTYIGLNIHAVRFIDGVRPREVLYLPVLYLVTHVVHVCLGSPNRLLVFLCLFGSPLHLMVLGDQVGRASERNAEGLHSNDCHSFAAKSELDAQWQAARIFYATCMAATSNATGSSFEDDIATYRIRDCAGYKEAAALHPGWSYLQQLEDGHRCAGWCAKSQAIWNKDPVQDDCVLVAAEVLGTQIRTAAAQVVIYSCLALLFLAVSAAIGQPLVSEWFGS